MCKERRARAVCVKVIGETVSFITALLRRNKDLRGANWEGRKGASVGGADPSRGELAFPRFEPCLSILKEEELGFIKKMAAIVGVKSNVW